MLPACPFDVGAMPLGVRVVQGGELLGDGNSLDRHIGRLNPMARTLSPSAARK